MRTVARQRLLLLTVMVLTAGTITPASVGTAFMPQPRSISYGDGWRYVKGPFAIEWIAYRSSFLDRAVLRFQNDFGRRTGLDDQRLGSTPLRIDCRGEDGGYLTMKAREHYVLAVTPGAVVLNADGPTGVLRGLATLRQSITDTPSGVSYGAP